MEVDISLRKTDYSRWSLPTQSSQSNVWVDRLSAYANRQPIRRSVATAANFPKANSLRPLDRSWTDTNKRKETRDYDEQPTHTPFMATIEPAGRWCPIRQKCAHLQKQKKLTRSFARRAVGRGPVCKCVWPDETRCERRQKVERWSKKVDGGD